MSEIGEKIKQVFGSAAVYKNPANYDIFSGRNLPSFVKDYLISTHIAPDGSFKRAELARFWMHIFPMITVLFEQDYVGVKR